MDNPKGIFVHPTAVVDQGVVVGKGTKVWHFCHLMGPSLIGENCNLGQNVVVSPHVYLGNGVKVQNNVSLFTGVKCEEDVFIGPSVVFTNVLNPRSFISRKAEFRKTLVRRGASLGANSTLVCGIEIGEYAFVGAGSVVTRDVPAFALVYGNPARQHGWISKAGHKLQFEADNQARCSETGELYFLSVEGVRAEF